MNLVHWTPFRELENLFDRYARDQLAPRTGEGEGDVRWRPAASIVETAKEFTIRADLPAVKREDIDVSIDNGVLTLKGERRYEKSTDEETEHRRESFYGMFSRSFVLPENIDTTAISADTKDGVLTVHLPKAKEDKPKSLQIKVG
jgi:HSP20 family protein